jgi:hypothetical protein
MATFFRNKVVKEIGTSDEIALTTDGATRSTVIGLSLANLTEYPVYASVKVVDDTSTEGFYLKEVMIPSESSLRALSAGEKLVLAPNNQLVIASNQPDSLDAIISYVDIV